MPTERDRLLDHPDGQPMRANAQNGLVQPGQPNQNGQLNEPDQAGQLNIHQQFENALREESPGTTVFDLIMRRPGTTILALSLFALVVLSTTWISALTDPEFVAKFVDVPNITPLSTKLLGVEPQAVGVAADVRVELNYTALGSGLLRQAAEKVSEKLGTINVRLDGPIVCSVQLDQGNEDHKSIGDHSGDDLSSDSDSHGWKQALSAYVENAYEIALVPDGRQDLHIEATLRDVGRTDVLGSIVQRLLRNDPVTVRATGTAVVSKYGLSVRTQFGLTTDIKVPQQTTEDLAEIAQIEVGPHGLHGLNVTALANASIGEFPVDAQLPALDWEVKIPGCTHDELEVLCRGANHEFALTSEDEIVSVLFSSIVDNLPPSLTEPCDRADNASTSPLDRWVAAYLAGEASTFYVRGVPRLGQPPILTELLTGYDVPYTVNGKPAGEKLIQSVALEEVRWSDAALEGDVSISDTMRFSGKALVDVVLPSFLEMKARTAVVVSGVRGNIQLFDENKHHFAQILASEKWLQTISLSNSEGYKVICYFDNLPAEIVDSSVFADISRAILLRRQVNVLYDAVVDVNFETTVGTVLMKRIRIKGNTVMQA